MDDIPSGRMTYDLSSWDGKAYKIPRMMIKNCNDRKLRDISSAVYFLLGNEDDEDGKKFLYVGQSRNALVRLSQHDDKDFWDEAIVFVRTSEQLNSTHIEYLEYRLYELAASVGRCMLTNSNKPSLPPISESDRAEMEVYIENLQLLMGALGYKLFQKKRTDLSMLAHVATNLISGEDSFVIFQINNKGLIAKGMQTPEGFLLLKDSHLVKETTPSLRGSLCNKRRRLVGEGKAIETENYIILNDDVLFNSPSQAASGVLGFSANGRTEWKLPDGMTLKEYEEKE
jgi:hypothetical protein